MSYSVDLERALVEARRNGYGSRVRELTKQGVGNTLAEKQAKAAKKPAKKAAAKTPAAKKAAPAKKTAAKKTTKKS